MSMVSAVAMQTNFNTLVPKKSLDWSIYDGSLPQAFITLSGRLGPSVPDLRSNITLIGTL